jgi:hypothetical protein
MQCTVVRRFSQRQQILQLEGLSANIAMATKELEMSCRVLETHTADCLNLLSTPNAMRVDVSGGRVVGLPMVKLLLRRADGGVLNAAAGAT